MSEEVAVKAKRKRRSLLEQAVVGDLVLCMDGAAVAAIERVVGASSAAAIVQRWRDQGIIGGDAKPQVWEAMSGGYYRLRRSR